MRRADRVWKLRENNYSMILDKFKLDGKTARYRSASGIGQACAIALAEAGADIACHCRKSGDAGETISTIEKLGRKAIEVTGDLADREVLGNDRRFGDRGTRASRHSDQQRRNDPPLSCRRL